MFLMKTHKRVMASILFLLVSNVFAEPVLTENLRPADAPKPKGRPSVALVLAGGGARGFVHIPIIEEIEALDIPIDCVVGTSIGSIIGGLYATGYSPKEMLDLVSSMNWASLFSDGSSSGYENTIREHSLGANLFALTMDWKFKPQLGSGISKGQRVYDLFRKMTLKYNSDASFNDLPVNFAAIGCDTLDGKSYVFRDGDISAAIRASMSIPGFFTPFTIGSHTFIDGGTLDNLAVDVAKNLGYDIIIAIDISQQIRDDPTMYEGSPTVALLNSMTIPQRHKVDEMLKDASLVITPDLKGYGIMAFKKAEAIYNVGKECAKEYQDALMQLRRRIYPGDYDAAGNRISSSALSPRRTRYSELPEKTISSFELRGELPGDTKYLTKEISRYVGQPLNEEFYSKIIERIYNTGNYKRVLPHLVKSGSDGTNKLIIEFEQENPRSAKIIIDANLESSLSSRSMTKFTFSPEIQYRGLTGSGSILAARGTFIDEMAGSLYFFTPFSPHIFMEIESDYYLQKFPFSTKRNGYSLIEEFRTFDNFVTFGTRTRRNFVIRASAFYKMARTDLYSMLDDDYLLTKFTGANLFKDSGVSTKRIHTAGVQLSFEYDNLDSKIFAQRGFFADITLKGIMPVYPRGSDITEFYGIGIVSLKEAIPFGKRVSLILDEFAGSNFSQRMLDEPGTVLTDGFFDYDRLYFPISAAKDRFGIHKIALAATIQAKIGDTLTVLGGDLFFRLTGSVGNVFYDYGNIVDADGSEGIMWAASAGLALRIKKQYGFYVRGGLGRNHEGNVRGFCAFDLGSFRF